MHPHLVRLRRSLQGGVAGVAFLLAAGAAASQPQAADPVKVTGGLISGVTSGAGTVYRGIPYAAPPEGSLRWRSPEPPRPWAGVRPANAYGAACAQVPFRPGLTEMSDQSREDCLFLNVWTPPSAPAGAKLPVMVWIHGGGFSTGSGSSETYNGDRLAAKGVIVVTLNYRLGAFGFLPHPELTAESPHRSSGNFGLEDQIAALRWVNANIAAFGGDPANVTLFGQSAGGASVLDLVSSPLTKGLVRQAIVQSGAARSGISVQPLAAAERQGVAFGAGRSIAELRKLDKAAVLQLTQAFGRSGGRLSPVLDGYVLTRDPVRSLADPAGKRMPLLIGSNSREGLRVLDSQELEPAIRTTFGAKAEEALALYGLGNGQAGRTDPLMGTAAQQFATDSTFRCGTVEAAAASASSGAPTWQYQFEQFVPGREAQGAAHSYEVPYTFGTLPREGFSGANYGPDDKALAEHMTSYWTNFAKAGDPNGSGLPAWPRHTPESRAYLRLSSQVAQSAEAAADLRGPLCRLFPAAAPN